MIEMPPPFPNDELTTEHVTEADLARFRAKYVVEGECWRWVGAITGHKQHQPHMRFRGAVKNVSHFLCYAMLGRFPNEQMLHTCDHPLCVRPTHLFEGSVLLNVVDCRRKDRHPIGKLTPEQKSLLYLCQSQRDLVKLAVKMGIHADNGRRHWYYKLAAEGDPEGLAEVERYRERVRSRRARLKLVQS